MAAKKKSTSPKSTTGKGKPNLTYDSHRTSASTNSRGAWGGPVGNKRGMRIGDATGESVRNGRIRSKTQLLATLYEGSPGSGSKVYEFYNKKTSDALVKPTVKKSIKKKSAIDFGNR